MIKELASSPYQSTEQTYRSMACTLEYFNRKVVEHRKGQQFLKRNLFILDVGQKSPLTDLIYKKGYGEPEIFNTRGDLDDSFNIYFRKYDYILYSHTIEHQFNPLYTLLQLKRAMSKKTTMFIILPQRPQFLWFKGHFHEIDDYRMRLLLKRAGLKIVSYEKHRPKRSLWFYFTGIRPIIRWFVEFNGYYEVVNK